MIGDISSSDKVWYHERVITSESYLWMKFCLGQVVRNTSALFVTFVVHKQGRQHHCCCFMLTFWCLQSDFTHITTQLYPLRAHLAPCQHKGTILLLFPIKDRDVAGLYWSWKKGWHSVQKPCHQWSTSPDLEDLMIMQSPVQIYPPWKWILPRPFSRMGYYPWTEVIMMSMVPLSDKCIKGMPWACPMSTWFMFRSSHGFTNHSLPIYG